MKTSKGACKLWYYKGKIVVVLKYFIFAKYDMQLRRIKRCPTKEICYVQLDKARNESHWIKKQLMQ
ncbi:hypothetical protein Lal_00013516 [Lupinus albus]|nr:hypothetical protein Lal_00013516 [Lupinus albus]